MLHFLAVPKGVELVQPLADVLLLVPGDLLDQVLLADQLLTLYSETILSIIQISKIPKLTPALARNIMVWFAQI